MALRIAFMGTGNFAVPVISKLHNNKFVIKKIYTKNVNKNIKTPVQVFAEEKNIPCTNVSFMDDASLFKEIKNLKLEAIVVVAFGQILKKDILNEPKFGCFNVHGSVLPRWRGSAPIQRSILAGDRETGVTIIKMDEGIDTGPILATENATIENSDNYTTLEKKLSQIGADLISENLIKFSQNKTNLKKQGEIGAIYAKKISKSESKINWEASANQILRVINASNPSPGAWFNYKGERIKIFEAQKIHKVGKPGTILDNELTISCGENSIQPIQLQRAGKKTLNIDDFLLGFKFSVGEKVN